jgi:hypothetical protein
MSRFKPGDLAMINAGPNFGRCVEVVESLGIVTKYAFGGITYYNDCADEVVIVRASEPLLTKEVVSHIYGIASACIGPIRAVRLSPLRGDFEPETKSELIEVPA